MCLRGTKSAGSTTMPRDPRRYCGVEKLPRACSPASPRDQECRKHDDATRPEALLPCREAHACTISCVSAEPRVPEARPCHATRGAVAVSRSSRVHDLLRLRGPKSAGGTTGRQSRRDAAEAQHDGVAEP